MGVNEFGHAYKSKAITTAPRKGLYKRNIRDMHLF